MLKRADVSIANAIRRAMISDVATIAIDLVTVNNNTSVFADEFIVHRLGMIPLQSMTADTFEFSRECVCANHCPNCAVEFQMVVANRGEVDTRDATTDDLK